MKASYANSLQLCIPILLLLLIFQNNTNAQNFQIKGKVIDVNDSIVYSTIQLRDVKSNLINGALTNNEGKFEIGNIPKSNYLLIVSSVGFTTDTIIINELSKDIDVGFICLKSSTTALGEVTITAKSVFNKEGIKYVVPPSKIVKTSSNGLMLLEKINLPRLRVDAVSKNIQVSGGGQVQLRINGREVSIQDINSLLPDEIIRIEYHDKPEAKYNYASAVLDFIVKHRKTGGNIFTEVWHGMLIPFGEDYLAAKLNNKKSEFAASYNLQYRDWNHLSRTNNETFHLIDKTITRYEDGKPADFEYYNHSAKLRYNYQDTNNILNISFAAKVTNQMHHDLEKRFVF